VSEYTALVGRLHESTKELERVIKRAENLREKALKTGDDGYWDAVALNLHGFYVGVERIFEDIARSIDESVPDGPDWHRELLLQVSADLSTVRPPVISRESRNCLDEYRGFRHLVRNVYTFNLRPSRLAELVENLAKCFRLVENDLNKFAEFLNQLS
jgi:hypothetical protein